MAASQGIELQFFGEIHPEMTLSFVRQSRQVLDEVELYLSTESGPISRESYESVGRRFMTLKADAESVGGKPVAELCSIGSERIKSFLHTRDATSAPPEGMLLALQYLRGYLRCMEMLSRGQHLPVGLDAFLGKIHQLLTAELNSNLLDSEDIPEEGGRNTGSVLKGLRVLVADDEEIVRVFLSDLLSRSGHLCMTVENGRDAMNVLETGLFDMVFTDLNMPGAQGIDVLKHARNVAPDTEVVIVTGYASVQNASEAVRFGAYDYLTKPFSGSAEILAVMQRVAKHQELRRENRCLMLSLKRRNEELKRYADSLQDALQVVEEKRRALIHADRMATLGALSAGVAHEINNPTTFIRGNLQTLEKFWELLKPFAENAAKGPGGSRMEFVLDEMPSLIKDMSVGTERISRIVSALRSFSHQGGVEKRESLNINACIKDALDLVHNRIKNIVEVEADLGEGLPCIHADAQQLTQVFVNLFVNAADAMEQCSSPRLAVKSEATEEGCRVSVRDNGVGIPDRIKDKIFDPFFTTKDVGKGTGLGLSILAGILRDHGGRVTVESEGEGMGTCFILTIPKDGNRRSTDNAHPSVLIVDDNTESAGILQSALQAAGDYSVKVVHSGQDGLTFIEKYPPDVVVLDIVMPGMDGFEFVENLFNSGRGSHPIVYAITGLDAGGVRERMLEMGVEEVFFKPFRMRTFIQRLDESLGKRFSNNIETV